MYVYGIYIYIRVCVSTEKAEHTERLARGCRSLPPPAKPVFRHSFVDDSAAADRSSSVTFYSPLFAHVAPPVTQIITLLVSWSRTVSLACTSCTTGYAVSAVRRVACNVTYYYILLLVSLYRSGADDIGCSRAISDPTDRMTTATIWSPGDPTIRRWLLYGSL